MKNLVSIVNLRSYLANPFPSPHSNPFLPLPLWSTLLRSKSTARENTCQTSVCNWRVGDADSSDENKASGPHPASTWLDQQITRYGPNLKFRPYKEEHWLINAWNQHREFPFDSEFAIIYRKLSRIWQQATHVFQRGHNFTIQWFQNYKCLSYFIEECKITYLTTDVKYKQNYNKVFTKKLMEQIIKSRNWLTHIW